MDHGDLRNACRRQPRLIGKAAPAFDKHLGLKKQIGAAGFDQPHHRHLVLHRDLLDAQMLLHAHRRRRTAFDGAVISGHDAADTRDMADAGNATAALNAFGTIIVVHAKAGERRQFEPWRPGIQHQCHALARQQLFAGAETVAFGIGDVAHFLLQRAKFADQRQHLLTVGAEALGIRIDAALDDRHGNLARTLSTADLEVRHQAANPHGNVKSKSRVRTIHVLERWPLRNTTEALTLKHEAWHTPAVGTTSTATAAIAKRSARAAAARAAMPRAR